MKYRVMSRKEFDRKFQRDKLGKWENFGGFGDKKSAINQMKTYSGEGEWGLVPKKRYSKHDGGYYNVLFKAKRRKDLIF